MAVASMSWRDELDARVHEAGVDLRVVVADREVFDRAAYAPVGAQVSTER